MNIRRLEKLKKNLHKLEVDLEKGIVYGPNPIRLNKKGYYVTALEGNYFIHEIIAVAGGLDILNLTIDHIDRNIQNNKFVNLEAVTQRENVRRGYDRGSHNHRTYDYMEGSNNWNHNSMYTEDFKRTIIEAYATGKYSYKSLTAKFGGSKTQNVRIIKAGMPLRK